MTEKEIQVSLSGDTLTIKGEKRQEREEKGENRHLSERSYGEFQRAFSLPADVAREKIEAAFANGVLTVTLPKTACLVRRRLLKRHQSTWSAATWSRCAPSCR